MKERPILFSAPMVQAILAGDKTQTRRICKSQPYSNGFMFDGKEILCHNDYLPPSAMLMDVSRGKIEYTTSNLEGWESECPFGKVGDQMWVRETFYVNDCRYPKGAPGTPIEALQADWFANETYYAADGLPDFEGEEGLIKWKPSIHMPRWASRIQVEITAIRIERLKDITAADSLAEGVTHCGHLSDHWNEYAPDEQFSMLWSAINGMQSWHENPWVWVIEFKRVERIKDPA